MELLKEISDGEMQENHSTRIAARAILFDDHNKLPILRVSKHNYHKLPGGRVEEGETKIVALKREVLEETGSNIQIEGTIGKITEYRKEQNLLQTSFCYYGNIISKDKTSFSKKEMDQGFELVWFDLDEAIYKLENDKPNNYQGGFIQKRDLAFLKEAKRLMKH